ncbi:MAG TPA: hypothetical protein VFO69_14130 [Allosphingosinicella sp.]|nr:hypothetical protein [Allosphingosinicella sp.]
METLAFVMAILGCGEGDLPCAELRLAQSRYANQAACLAATEVEIARHGDLDYPVIVAQCRRSDAAPQPILASEVSLPEPEANPHFPTSRQR